MRPKVALGRVFTTPGVREVIQASHVDLGQYVRRHERGDWGDLDADDKVANDQAMHTGGRLLSAYHLPEQLVIWIITEADRTVTTCLLPEEY